MSMDIGTFLQLTLNGVAVGCIYGLVALGFVLIYKATETINFAQGEFMMIGAFLAFTGTVIYGLPLAVAIVGAVLITAGVGIALDRMILRRVLGESQFTIVMLTIGVGYVLRGLVTMIPGWGTETYALPSPVSGQVLRAGAISLSAEHLTVIAATLVLCLALFVFFRRSVIGVAMQAVSQNQIAAYLVGIPVSRMNAIVWGLSAAIGAIAGILLAPFSYVHANMGLIGIKAFPAAVLGGFGSIPGALIGGLLIGLIEAYAGFFMPEGYKDVAAYVVLLIVLIIWPSGLFGERFTKRV
ncbi:branched-chain amino acid ABC transporter permease [Pseudorhodoplanes sp.]|uniref:branched-chain amino acid ABC transporter permease n=1 Tax=Pseudorhodoplanes sp. TaxID=1934341 RepID=UPI003D096A07